MSDAPETTDAPEVEPLTERELVFVAEFLVDLRASDAYRRAFAYKGPAAKELGYQMRRRPSVKAEIERRIAEREDDAAVRHERIKRELEVIAFSNEDDYRVAKSGRLTLRAGVDRSARRAIASTKVKRTTRHEKQPGTAEYTPVETVETEFRLWNKNEALRDLAKIEGIYVEKSEITDKTLEQMLREIDPGTDRTPDADGRAE